MHLESFLLFHIIETIHYFCSLPEPSYSLAFLVIYAFLSLSYLKRKGIVINETEVVLYGQLLTGRKYVPKANGVVELEKQWAKQVLPFAYQAVVKVPAHKQDIKNARRKLRIIGERLLYVTEAVTKP